jgi:O-antigen ligase
MSPFTPNFSGRRELTLSANMNGTPTASGQNGRRPYASSRTLGAGRSGIRRSARQSKDWRFALLGPVSIISLVVCLVFVRSDLLSPLLVFALLGAALIFMAFPKPMYVFYAVVMLLPFEVLYVPGIPLNVQMALFLAIAGLVIGCLRLPSFPRTAVDHIFLLYLGVLVLSMVQMFVFSSLEPPQLLPSELGLRASHYRGWYHLAAELMGIALVYFVAKNVSSPARLKGAVLALLSVSFSVSVYAFYEAAAKLFGLPLVYFSFQDSDYVSPAQYSIASLSLPRVYGSAMEPLTFGNFLILPLSFCGAFVILGMRLRGHRKLHYGTLATVVLAIVLTFSTSAWFGAFVSVCVLLALGWSRRIYRIVIPVSAVLMFILLLLPLGTQETLRSIAEFQQKKIEGSLYEDTRNFRYQGWQRSLSLIPRFPILGVGLGNEPFWMDSPDMSIGSYNILLSRLVETGVVGCGLFLYLMLKLVRLFRTTYRRAADPEQRAISLGCAAALIGCLASHMAWGGRLASWEWFTIGLGLAAYRMFRMEARVRAPSRLNDQISLPRHSSPSSASA